MSNMSNPMSAFFDEAEYRDGSLGALHEIGEEEIKVEVAPAF